MKARPPFVFALAFALSSLIMSLGLGCDASPTPIEVRDAAADLCAESCAPDLCDAFDDAATFAPSCELDCYLDAIECLHAAADPGVYAGECGECEHVAAECRTACSFDLVAP